ncbi:MAG: hypothetical protein JJ863_10015 [Deltaproteobacteria bacterium]|nr:hypothetical protein [Deltaproteobacteria bacterium]
MNHVRIAVFIGLASFVLGCDSGGGDTGDAAPATCTSDVECSDGIFCNGVERCAPSSGDADSLGCVLGADPCLPAQMCDEGAQTCRTVCAVTADADGDGSLAVECGGADCDDSNADRFPGATEVCDDEGVDEDCNPLTIGTRDEDADGFIDAACCNVVPGAATTCGTDCDDATASVGPRSPETCDGIDQDCDGAIDEGVSRRFFPDVDGDGWGDRDGDPQLGCGVPDGFVENTLDCNDGDATVSPSGLEVCNGRDDDCDGATDEPEAVAVACASTFGSPPNTPWTCVGGMCQTACAATHGDCDLEPSNGCESELATDVANCGACGNDCGIGGQCTDGVCDRVIDVEAGADFTCAVRSGRRNAVCWGNNEYGQLGNGSFSGGPTPREVTGLQGVIGLSLATGRGHPSTGEDVTGFACAYWEGQVSCWGGGAYGQIGTGIALSTDSEPSAVAGVPRIDLGRAVVLDVNVGGWHSCVVQEPITSGTQREVIDCWGRNLNGAIEGGGSSAYVFPEEVLLRLRSTRPVIGLGLRHTCFFSRNGEAAGGHSLVCRGFVSGTWTDAVDYVQLVGGDDFECGLDSAGTVRCWGDNNVSQLGLGDTADRANPTVVSGLTGITQVDAGGEGACALRDDGRVLCWGRQPGIIRSSPTLIDGVTDVVDVSVGADHTCAVTAMGEVYCWGSQRDGQTGTPVSTSPLMVPTLVPNL